MNAENVESITNGLMDTIIQVHPNRVAWGIVPIEADYDTLVTVRVVAVEAVNPFVLYGGMLKKYGEDAFAEQLTVTIIRNDCEQFSTYLWTFTDDVQPEPWKA
jgi:hypothetical protein